MEHRPVIIDAQGLDTLIGRLRSLGHAVIGPRLRDQAIVYDEIDGVADLPRGIIDDQDGGHYRLREEGEALFGYACGPTSWKRFLHQPRQTLWRTRREHGFTKVIAEQPAGERYAFIGVRACEMEAIAIQDRVLLREPHSDPHYRARREGAFILAVNCARAAATCFCVSANTGPRVRSGYDLALTELDAQSLLVEAGSERGQQLLAELPARAASDEAIGEAHAISARTAQSMQRHLPDGDVRGPLQANLDHPRWADIADRCLACGNCTMVCPTCFCTSVEDASDLSGVETRHERRWDSCFTRDYSYIHGGDVRTGTRSRYRQWLTHKLSSWHDQFGTSGCVGCGRCITWCPVGIDLTEEAAVLCATPQAAE